MLGLEILSLLLVKRALIASESVGNAVGELIVAGMQGVEDGVGRGLGLGELLLTLVELLLIIILRLHSGLEKIINILIKRVLIRNLN